MKVNRSQFFADRNMRRKGNNKERYEQKLAYELLKAHLPFYYQVEMEYSPKDLTPLENEATDLTGDRSPQLDIAILCDNFKLAIRLNGGYHDRKKRQRYDFAQRTFLEKQPNPWIVIDYTPDDFPRLFDTHDNEPTPVEILRIYKDLYQSLYHLIPISRKPKLYAIQIIKEKIHHRTT